MSAFMFHYEFFFKEHTVCFVPSFFKWYSSFCLLFVFYHYPPDIFAQWDLLLICYPHEIFTFQRAKKLQFFKMLNICEYFRNLDPVSKSDKTIWGQIYWLDIVYIIQSYICASHSMSETYIFVYVRTVQEVPTSFLHAM